MGPFFPTAKSSDHCLSYVEVIICCFKKQNVPTIAGVLLLLLLYHPKMSYRLRKRAVLRNPTQSRGAHESGSFCSTVTQ